MFSLGTDRKRLGRVRFRRDCQEETANFWELRTDATLAASMPTLILTDQRRTGNACGRLHDRRDHRLQAVHAEHLSSDAIPTGQLAFRELNPAFTRIGMAKAQPFDLPHARSVHTRRATQ